MNIDSLIQFGMLLAAVIAIIISQINERKQRKFALYAEYTRRYQELFLNMPDDVYNGTAPIDARTKKYMRLYFDLCNEEYHLKEDGVISGETWRLWKEGMQIATKHKIYKNSWEAIKTEYDNPFLQFFESEVINKKEK